MSEVIKLNKLSCLILIKLHECMELYYFNFRCDASNNHINEKIFLFPFVLLS